MQDFPRDIIPNGKTINLHKKPVKRDDVSMISILFLLTDMFLGFFGGFFFGKPSKYGEHSNLGHTRIVYIVYSACSVG